MTLTTDVTWGDLDAALQSELDELREAHEELAAQAREEYGEGWRDQSIPSDPELLNDDERRLYVYRQELDRLNEQAKLIQRRQHLLGKLSEEYGDGAFTVKMLSGQETMDIETRLRMEAGKKGVDTETIQMKRNGWTVDAATVDAPEGIPREDGSPKPSECENALTLALWEQVQGFNSSGATDFQPAGLGETDRPDPGVSSAAPTTSATPSVSSESDGESVQPPTDSSAER